MGGGHPPHRTAQGLHQGKSGSAYKVSYCDRRKLVKLAEKLTELIKPTDGSREVFVLPLFYRFSH